MPLHDGGETRFHSVKNGLALVKTPALVGVHDGVRPFVAREVIARCYDLAAEKKAVIPVIGVVETVRRMEGESSVTVGRMIIDWCRLPRFLMRNC